jgi:hypothetical protein
VSLTKGNLDPLDASRVPGHVWGHVARVPTVDIYSLHVAAGRVEILCKQT